HRATRSIERNPKLAAALITAVTSPDPAIQECQSEIAQIMSDVLSTAMEGVDPELAAGVCRVLSHEWFSALLGWVNGWSNGANLGEELEVAARLLLRSA